METMHSISAVDTHVHLWDLDIRSYKWPTKIEEEKIYRNFLLNDYECERSHTPIRNAVFVEAHNSVSETRWALEISQMNGSPFKGVVGYAHVGSADQADVELEEFTRSPTFVGVRCISDFESEGWLAQENVQEGLEVVEKYNLTYDLLLRKKDLWNARTAVRRHPGLKFVIDHLAKPNAKDGETREWFDGMKELASYANVYCKLSGMVTEADLCNWKPDDFKQYVKHVLHIFGNDRVMFGSDWPVCMLANCDLKGVYDLLNNLLGELSNEEKKKVFETNAIEFYNLKI